MGNAPFGGAYIPEIGLSSVNFACVSVLLESFYEGWEAGAFWFLCRILCIFL